MLANISVLALLQFAISLTDLLPVIAAVFLIRHARAQKSNLPLPVWVFIGFCLFSLGITVSQYSIYFIRRDTSYYFLLHWFTLGEFILLMTVFSFWQSRNFLSWVIRGILIPSYVAFWVFAKTNGMETFSEFDEITLSVSNVLILVMIFPCWAYWTDYSVVPAKYNPYFIILLGLLAYHFGSAVFFAIDQSNGQILMIHLGLMATCNLFFARGLFLLQRTDLTSKLRQI